MRTALTLAAQLAQRASRARQQQLREPEAASAQRAAELQARFDAERSAAVAALTPVGRDDPWATVCQQDIADMYRTARTWEDVAPSAREAADRIEREVDTRYRIDPTSLERAGALDRPPSPSRPGASAQRGRPTRGAKHSCGQDRDPRTLTATAARTASLTATTRRGWPRLLASHRGRRVSPLLAP